MALWRNSALAVLSVLVSSVCLHAGAASLRRVHDAAPSQGSQRWKPLFLCVEEERECEHVGSSNFTEEFSKCSVIERRYCVPHDKTVDCCTNISAPSVVELCSHLTKSSAKMTVSCRQFRRELSTASDEPLSQSSLHVALPKGASSTQIYGLGQNQDMVNIYLDANQSQKLSFNDTVLTHKGVRMSFKSNRTEGWYRILVRQKTPEAIDVTFEAVSSVIFYYTMSTPDAVSGGSSDYGFFFDDSWCAFYTAYRWEYGEFGHCSTTCGIGKKYKKAVCTNMNSGRVVDDYFCQCQEPLAVIVVNCPTQRCEPRWVTGMWSNCSKSCGGGYEQREVLCQRDISEDKFEIIYEHEEDYCDTQHIPNTLQSCEGQLCLFIWVPQAWSSCSSQCSPGTQLRVVQCQALNGTVANDSACLSEKPITRQSCNLDPKCYYEWGQPTEWGECHGDCRVSTSGRRYRTVQCLAKDSSGLSNTVSEQFCDADRKPVDSTSCQLSCNLGEWRVVGTVQPCNATCGTDVYEVKKLACFNEMGVLVSNRLCPYRPSTLISERCDLPSCPPPPDCSDTAGDACPDLVRQYQCNDYVRQLCCKSCHL